MHLFVLRHGIADAQASADFDRHLTLEGRQQFSRAVRGLQSLGIELDRVLHSPLVRAVETAELLEPLLTGSRDVLPALADAPGELLLEALAGAGERVALVGHEPWQSQVVAWLTCGDRRLGPAFHLSKGAVVRLQGKPEASGMHMTGYWRPDLLGALGSA